ncbi:RebB family R body protein [Sneathiella litorea]|uniref:RebB like protein n=1 Tax=Sneathiella litorea TaxID=2606216 RepID=A0A6L8W9L1_9PROT|nr:RebB family R body protein [Sneathiella litorea]MZR31786.1 RebB like protein [Sneathiella litorea]
MTSESYVNSQITGSIAQTNLSVLGDAPAEAMGILYQQMAHTIGLALQNVISQQQHSYSIHNAITIAASKQLLNSDPAAAAKASQELIAGSAIPENLAALQAVVNELGKQQ